jgi:hypothetical protein
MPAIARVGLGAFLRDRDSTLRSTFRTTVVANYRISDGSPYRSKHDCHYRNSRNELR